MIASLRGKLIKKDPQHAVLDVGGVGYRVFITLNCYEWLPRVGEEANLFTVTISREDALHLYGFKDESEREMFLKLISVTRIGPKLARAILSGANAEALRNAIVTRDAESISRMPGVGPKTAERIIVELKDKVTPAEETATLISSDPAAADALAALVNLGYKRPTAQKAVMKVTAENTNEDVGEIIRKALAILSL